jgi:hypothetical protein|tara:strand:+ start:1039 stop:1755 length:717 start_codon:yes stop_codon:yes gene_type:complete
MGLPKIDQPLFELVIPSTGKKATYRPFTVKEEKILLIAQESKEMDQIILAVKQIINNCVTDIDVDSLATFDLEYIILNIRAKSVNNEMTFSITDPDTKESVELSMDVNDIEIYKDEKHTKKIDLNEQYYIMMRYPSINEVKALQPTGDNNDASAEAMFGVMMACIETTVNTENDEVFNLADFTPEEVNEFVEGFTSSSVTAIQEFFTTMPKMKYSIPYKDNTGKDKEFNVEGMESFFT